jgi:hypothetical protein
MIPEDEDSTFSVTSVRNSATRQKVPECSKFVAAVWRCCQLATVWWCSNGLDASVGENSVLSKDGSYGGREMCYEVTIKLPRRAFVPHLLGGVDDELAKMKKHCASSLCRPYRLSPARSYSLFQLGRAGPGRAEPSRAGPGRAEPSRAEPGRAGPSRAGPSRAEPSRAGPGRAEPSRVSS